MAALDNASQIDTHRFTIDILHYHHQHQQPG